MRTPRWCGRVRALVLASLAVLVTGSGLGAHAALDGLLGGNEGLLGDSDSLGPGLDTLLNPPASPAATGPNGLAATASGMVFHAGALANLVSVDVARSAAAATLEASRSATGDLGRVEVPPLPPKGSYGRGAGISTGLGLGDLSVSSAGGTGGAEAQAPPNSGVVRHEGAPLSVAGLIRGGVLRGQAEARSAAMGCLLGADLSSGRGEVGDLDLLGLATLAEAPDVALSHSVSRTLVVPGTGGRLALRSETRQRISPITFLGGTPTEFTIHTDGEWVLRAEADGRTGSVSYGPAGGDAAGARTVKIVNGAGVVLAQGSPGPDAASVRLEIPGVAEIVLGEGPRQPGGAGPAQASPTRAAAAADLLRVRLLGQDIRIGHMEAAVSVPAAGVECPTVGSTVTAQEGEVQPGAEFPIAVRIANPNDGTLTVPVLTARVGAPDGVAFEIVGDDGAKATREAVAWHELSVPPGATIERRARVRVAPFSGPGGFRLEANGDGAYGPAAGSAPGDGTVLPVAVRAFVDGPTVAAYPVVPEVVGRRVVEATAVLEAAGFKVTVEQAPPGGAAGVVTAQRPMGRAAPGSLITLVVPAAAPTRQVTAAAPTPPASTPVRATPAVTAPTPPTVAEPMPSAPEAEPAPAPMSAPAGEAIPATPKAPEPRTNKPAEALARAAEERDSRLWWTLVAFGLIGAVTAWASRARRVG